MANDSQTVPAKHASNESHSAPTTGTVKALRDQINHLLDSFSSSRSLNPFDHKLFDVEPLWRWRAPIGPAMPAIDLVEKDHEYKISAELPGMEEKDLEISMTGDTLTITGEKKAQKEEKAKDYYMAERSYGTFRRAIQLPEDVDKEKVNAKYEKGVLIVRLPKLPGAETRSRKIVINKPA
jgi:HSP20 family protein